MKLIINHKNKHLTPQIHIYILFLCVSSDSKAKVKLLNKLIFLSSHTTTLLHREKINHALDGKKSILKSAFVPLHKLTRNLKREKEMYHATVVSPYRISSKR